MKIDQFKNHFTSNDYEKNTKLTYRVQNLDPYPPPDRYTSRNRSGERKKKREIEREVFSVAGEVRSASQRARGEERDRIAREKNQKSFTKLRS